MVLSCMILQKTYENYHNYSEIIYATAWLYLANTIYLQSAIASVS